MATVQKVAELLKVQLYVLHQSCSCLDNKTKVQIKIIHHEIMTGDFLATNAAHPSWLLLLCKNDTSHVPIYLTLGFYAEWLTFVAIETEVRFQSGLCAWMWWFGHFWVMEQFSSQGINPLLIHAAAPYVAADWMVLNDFRGSSSVLLTQFNFSFTARVCVCLVWFQSLGDPIW